MFISVPLSIFINFDWPSCAYITSQIYCQKIPEQFRKWFSSSICDHEVTIFAQITLGNQFSGFILTPHSHSGLGIKKNIKSASKKIILPSELFWFHEFFLLQKKNYIFNKNFVKLHNLLLYLLWVVTHWPNNSKRDKSSSIEMYRQTANDNMKKITYIWSPDNRHCIYKMMSI